MPKMIRIECQREGGKIINLSVKGHANSAPHGEDLICSAVSAVVFGGLNALENAQAFKIETDEEKGILNVEAKKDVSLHDYQVLDTIMIQLKSIEESAPKYIRIVEKGC